MAVTKNDTKANAPAEQKADKLAPATEFAASGAIIEPTIIERVDMSSDSVDSNPRERSTADMNRIDFNEPSAITPVEEAVAKNLKNG